MPRPLLPAGGQSLKTRSPPSVIISPVPNWLVYVLKRVRGDVKARRQDSFYTQTLQQILHSATATWTPTITHDVVRTAGNGHLNDGSASRITGQIVAYVVCVQQDQMQLKLTTEAVESLLQGKSTMRSDGESNDKTATKCSPQREQAKVLEDYTFWVPLRTLERMGKGGSGTLFADDSQTISDQITRLLEANALPSFVKRPAEAMISSTCLQGRKRRRHGSHTAQPASGPRQMAPNVSPVSGELPPVDLVLSDASWNPQTLQVSWPEAVGSRHESLFYRQVWQSAGFVQPESIMPVAYGGDHDQHIPSLVTPADALDLYPQDPDISDELVQ